MAKHQLNKSVIVIGRNPKASDIILPEDFGRISRLHAEIRREQNGYVIRNMSPNGTSVNGEQIDVAVLQEGDRITLGGQADFTYRAGTLEGPGSSREKVAPPPKPPDKGKGRRSDVTPWLIIGGAVVLIAIVLAFVMQGRTTDPTEIARNVTRRWVFDDIHRPTMTDQITADVIGRVPLETPVLNTKIAEQIGQESAWTFNDPQKVTEGTYRVVATAQISLRIIDTGTYNLTVPYRFTVDTEREAVRQYELGTINVVGQ